MNPFLLIPLFLLVFAIGGIIGSRTRGYDEGYTAGWSDHAAFIETRDRLELRRHALRAQAIAQEGDPNAQSL